MNNRKKPGKPVRNGDADAQDYVLGGLSRRDRLLFEDRLQSELELQAEVHALQHVAAGLAGTIQPVEPGDDLLAAIHAAIDGQPQPGSTTVRASEGKWKRLFPGVHKKLLLRDAEDGMESFLLRIEPGGSLSAHGHTRTEECIVLEGEVIIGEARFHAGDYHAAPPDIGHLPVTTETGTLLFIRSEIHR